MSPSWTRCRALGWRALLVALTLGAFVGWPVQPAAAAPLKVGSQLPGATFTDLQGNKRRLPDEVAGKVAVIHFWTTGCSSCREEMPALEKLSRSYQQRGVAVVAVNVGQSLTLAKQGISGLGTTFPVFADVDRKGAGLYGVTGVPATFVLDRSGSLRFKILGPTPPETLKKFVLSLLER